MDDTVGSAISSAFGLIGVWWTVFQHRGRGEIARAWTSDRGPRGGGYGTGPERALVITPFAVFGCISMALVLIPVHAVQVAGGFTALTAFTAATIFRYSRLPIPRWVMPKWYRDGNHEVYRTYIERQRRRDRKRARARRPDHADLSNIEPRT